jgi:hypothetical protein
MEINSTGITKSTLDDYLAFWTNKLREKYGSSFVIKKDGYVDNLATAASLTCLDLEDKVMELAKNLNPMTAEGEWQDQLYSLVNLVRQYADFTVVQRTISGVAGTVCDVGSVRFKNAATDDIFELNTKVTIGEDGTAKGSFTAIELGAVDLDEVATLTIIDAPEGITGVYFTEGDGINLGDDYEDDSEFRSRWIVNQSDATSATQGGVEAALLPLVEYNTSNLKVRQNRSSYDYAELPLHTMEIVINTPESDDTIAKTIFNNLMDGVGVYGNTTVTLKDSVGTPVEIKFTRATAVPIYFEVELVLADGYVLEQVDSTVAKTIADNFKADMGERIIANDYYQYINEVEGVDYVTSLKIRTADGSLVDTIPIEYNQFATNLEEHNTVSEG